MNSKDRRKKIVEIIKNSNVPVSGFTLANELNVSRQLIVGDVALIRASGIDIIATPKGYILNDLTAIDNSLIRTIACKHNKDESEDELNIIVDEGVTILNVIVEHSLYGQITGDLHISSRRDVSEFMNKINLDNVQPLLELTKGIHLHTIKCRDEKNYEQVVESLKNKGYLL